MSDVDALAAAEESVWPDMLRNASPEHIAMARAALRRDAPKVLAALRESGWTVERMRLREAAQEVVAMAESYSSEDRFGIYPMALFKAVAEMRAALAQPPAAQPDEPKEDA